MRYQINKQKYLSKAEINELIHAINNNSRDALLIKLAIETGARAQELLNIKKTDLDDANCTVFIRGLKGSDDREIPIDETLYYALRTVQNESMTEYLFDIGYSRLVAIWKHYSPNRKSFKCLRHTFAMELYKRSKDLLLLKTALGHRCISNTLVYSEHFYQTNQLNLLKKYRK